MSDTKFYVGKLSMTYQSDWQTTGNESGYKLDKFNRPNKNEWNCLLIRPYPLLKKYRPYQ